MKLKPSSRLPGLGITVANELLKVHVSYGPLVQKLLKKFNKGTRRSRAVKGLVHITGGGFVDNIPRVLPDGCNAIITRGTWDVLPIYELLQASGEGFRRRDAPSVQHGHRHGGDCPRRPVGWRAAFHPRAKDERLGDRLYRQRRPQSATRLSLGKRWPILLFRQRERGDFLVVSHEHVPVGERRVRPHHIPAGGATRRFDQVRLVQFLVTFR